MLEYLFVKKKIIIHSMEFFEMCIFLGKINNFKNLCFFYQFIGMPRYLGIHTCFLFTVNPV